LTHSLKAPGFNPCAYMCVCVCVCVCRRASHNRRHPFQLIHKSEALCVISWFQSLLFQMQRVPLRHVWSFKPKEAEKKDKENKGGDNDEGEEGEGGGKAAPDAPPGSKQMTDFFTKAPGRGDEGKGGDDEGEGGEEGGDAANTPEDMDEDEDAAAAEAEEPRPVAPQTVDPVEA
jgi:hypothetical protein